MEAVAELLQAERFKQWLEATEPGAVVGRALFCNACPLYEYLTGSGFDGVMVVPDRVTWIDERGHMQTYYVSQSPETAWVAEFVGTVDYRSAGMGAAVTAEQALRALAEALEPASALAEATV